MSSFSSRLRAKIDLVGGRRRAAARDLWNHPQFAELFPDLLFRIHSIIRASVPLMEAGCRRAEQMTDSDPVAALLADYLRKHIPEELGHDDWVLEDLEVLGANREDVLARQPSSTVAALVGAQYYWIFHHHPIALLGYIAVLEGSPPKIENLEEVIARTGLPEEAFSAYRKHAHLDIIHSGDLDDLLDRLPLRREHSSVIGVSATQTVHLLGRSVEEMVARHDRQRT